MSDRPRPRSESVCLMVPGSVRTKCGRRRPNHITVLEEYVTCDDCIAALNADRGGTR